MSSSTTNFPDEAVKAVEEFKRIAAEFHVKLPPKQPEGLEAENDQPGKVDLTWQEKEYDEDGFEIQRTEPNGTEFKHLENVGRGVYSFVDTGLVKGKYSYRVRSVNRRADSEYATTEIDVN